MAIAHFFLLLGEGILLNLQQSFIRVGPGASFGQIHGKIVFREIVLKVRMTHLLCRKNLRSVEMSEFSQNSKHCYIFQISTQCCNYNLEN